MATLQIFVVNPPKQCFGYSDIELVLSTKEGDFPPNFVGENELRFDLSINIRPDRSGIVQAWGSGINRQGDGRRFVYLSWIGNQSGTMDMFRRLKVFLNQVPDFPGKSDNYSVKVHGRDAKGNPACATAVVLG